MDLIIKPENLIFAAINKILSVNDELILLKNKSVDLIDRNAKVIEELKNVSKTLESNSHQLLDVSSQTFIEMVDEGTECHDLDVNEKMKHEENNDGYSKDDMLYYIDKFKHDFLTFLERNRGKISIQSNCDKYFRSMSLNQKPVLKSGRSKSKETKNNVMEVTYNSDVTSTLYDDLDIDFDPSTKKEGCKNDVEKVGGDNRITRLGDRSVMHILKNRQEVSRKRNKSWDKEIDKIHKAHDSLTNDKKEHNNHSQPSQTRTSMDLLKPVEETLYTRRMRERTREKSQPIVTNEEVSTIQKKTLEINISSSEVVDLEEEEEVEEVEVEVEEEKEKEKKETYTTELPKVKYDLSEPDSCTFQVSRNLDKLSINKLFDQKDKEIIEKEVCKTRELEKQKSPIKTEINKNEPENIKTVSDVINEKSDLNKSIKKDKMKKKRKHTSTSKKHKKNNKELEDGEII